MKRDLSIFVFVDALGWELVSRHGFLDRVLTTRTPVETVLGYSATCIPTILTGRLPREHGHFSFFYRPPTDAASGRPAAFKAMRLLSLLPSSVTGRGRVRRLMSRGVQKAMGYTGYFQLYNVPFEYLPCFDYSEKRDLYQPGGINSGAPTIFDLLREHEVPFHLSDWRASEETNLRSLEAAIEQGRIRFAYLYLSALDGRLHAEGTESPRVARHLAWYQEQLGALLEKASRRYRDVSLSVFSDHGMADVREDYDLKARVDRLGLRFGQDYVAMYDSTMARFWFMESRAERLVRGLLENDEKGRILSDGELAAFGCDFEDRRYGELIFLTRPGVLVCPSFMGERTIAGMHGYDPSDRASTAVFLSNRAPEGLPCRLDDLFGIMRSAALAPTGATRGVA